MESRKERGKLTDITQLDAAYWRARALSAEAGLAELDKAADGDSRLEVDRLRMEIEVLRMEKRNLAEQRKRETLEDIEILKKQRDEIQRLRSENERMRSVLFENMLGW